MILYMVLGNVIMELVNKQITFSPVLNIGFGYVKSDVGVKGECKFKSKIYLIPFLAITYTEVYVA